MSRRPLRMASLLTAALLVLSACGVSRDDATTGDTAVESSTETTADPSAPLDPNVQPTAPPPPVATTVIPDGLDAAVITFASGESVTVSGDAVKDLVAEVDASSDFKLLVTGGGAGLGPTFGTDVLSRLIFNHMLDDQLEQLDLTVSDDDVQARFPALLTELEGAFAQGGDPGAAGTAARVVDAIPNYLNVVAERIAKADAVTVKLEEEGETTELETICSRHILMATELEAEAAIVRLDAGDDFAELAAELSTGPTGPDGGDLGCSDPSSFVPEFADAITGAPIGDILGPVQTQFGFHVITVYDIKTEEQPADGQLLFREAFEALLAETTVDIDPFFGTWDAVSAQVVPAGG